VGDWFRARWNRPPMCARRGGIFQGFRGQCATVVRSARQSHGDVGHPCPPTVATTIAPYPRAQAPARRASRPARSGPSRPEACGGQGRTCGQPRSGGEPVRLPCTEYVAIAGSRAPALEAQLARSRASSSDRRKPGMLVLARWAGRTGGFAGDGSRGAPGGASVLQAFGAPPRACLVGGNGDARAGEGNRERRPREESRDLLPAKTRSWREHEV